MFKALQNYYSAALRGGLTFLEASNLLLELPVHSWCHRSGPPFAFYFPSESELVARHLGRLRDLGEQARQSALLAEGLAVG